MCCMFKVILALLSCDWFVCSLHSLSVVMFRLHCGVLMLLFGSSSIVMHALFVMALQLHGQHVVEGIMRMMRSFKVVIAWNAIFVSVSASCSKQKRELRNGSKFKRIAYQTKT